MKDSLVYEIKCDSEELFVFETLTAIHPNSLGNDIGVLEKRDQVVVSKA
jgi:hypothetical protein